MEQRFKPGDLLEVLSMGFCLWLEPSPGAKAVGELYRGELLLFINQDQSFGKDLVICRLGLGYVSDHACRRHE